MSKRKPTVEQVAGKHWSLFASFLEMELKNGGCYCGEVQWTNGKPCTLCNWAEVLREIQAASIVRFQELTDYDKRRAEKAAAAAERRGA